MPARRRVGRQVPPPAGRSGRMSRPVARRRRRRRPERRELHARPRGRPGRVPGVHGQMGAPEHAVLGHWLRPGRGRGPVDRAVRVPVPPSPARQGARGRFGGQGGRQRRRQREQRRQGTAERRRRGRRRGQDRSHRAPALGRLSSQVLL